jgi:hypothetical protein
VPSPRIRAKALRDTLTEAEEIELVLGPDVGAPSLFGSAAERAGARALLARVQEDRDPMDALLASAPVDRERSRRHHAAGHPGTDPDYPAVHDARDCPLCNRVKGD